jgi:uncharacterized protein YndB with AHSA1/START domain
MRLEWTPPMTNWIELQPVGLDFIDDAPLRIEVSTQTTLAPQEIWNALIDAGGWAKWFPGVQKAGYRPPAPPHGVGTIRFAEVSGVQYEETMLAWDAPTRWIYRIDRSTSDLARAQVEATLVESQSKGRTRVVWILACDPRPAMAAAADALPQILEGMLCEALQNLERLMAGPNDESAMCR